MLANPLHIALKCLYSQWLNFFFFLANSGRTFNGKMPSKCSFKGCQPITLGNFQNVKLHPVCEDSKLMRSSWLGLFKTMNFNIFGDQRMLIWISASSRGLEGKCSVIGPCFLAADLFWARRIEGWGVKGFFL